MVLGLITRFFVYWGFIFYLFGLLRRSQSGLFSSGRSRALVWPRSYLDGGMLTVRSMKLALSVSMGSWFAMFPDGVLEDRLHSSHSLWLFAAQRGLLNSWSRMACRPLGGFSDAVRGWGLPNLEISATTALWARLSSGVGVALFGCVCLSHIIMIVWLRVFSELKY